MLLVRLHGVAFAVLNVFILKITCLTCSYIYDVKSKYWSGHQWLGLTCLGGSPSYDQCFNAHEAQYHDTLDIPNHCNDTYIAILIAIALPYCILGNFRGKISSLNWFRGFA